MVHLCYHGYWNKNFWSMRNAMYNAVIIRLWADLGIRFIVFDVVLKWTKSSRLTNESVLRVELQPDLPQSIYNGNSETTICLITVISLVNHHLFCRVCCPVRWFACRAGGHNRTPWLIRGLLPEGTRFKSQSGRIFVIVVVHIQCSKLFKGIECRVLPMVLCTIYKNYWSHSK